jgi:hypothetical protein
VIRVHSRLLFSANPSVCAYVSSFKGERYGGKEEFQQKEEFKLEEEIQRSQIQQEGQPGSTNGNAPHAFRQAQSKEPQAGHCHWAFQSAAEGCKSAQEVIQSKESGLIHLKDFVATAARQSAHGSKCVSANGSDI